MQYFESGRVFNAKARSRKGTVRFPLRKNRPATLRLCVFALKSPFRLDERPGIHDSPISIACQTARASRIAATSWTRKIRAPR